MERLGVFLTEQEWQTVLAALIIYDAEMAKPGPDRVLRSHRRRITVAKHKIQEVLQDAER